MNEYWPYDGFDILDSMEREIYNVRQVIEAQELKRARQVAALLELVPDKKAAIEMLERLREAHEQR